MKIAKNPFEYRSGRPSVVTIGKFDGVHRGHQELIRRAVGAAKRRREAGEDCQAVVFTFDMSPVMILSKKERRAFLREMGVDLVIECAFDPRVIATSAEDFVRDILVSRLRVCKVVTGEDFRFGYRRRGDAALLQRLGGELGFEEELVPAVTGGGTKISSTRIREALAKGEMEEAALLLGFPYFIRGKIVHGREIGRTIGVPTANLIPDKSKLLPPNGVYFAKSGIGGRTYRGISNVGTKPTVDGHFTGVETYYFDLHEDLYGEELAVELCHFRRPERRFESLEELKGQIALDREAGEAYFAADLAPPADLNFS